MPPARDPISFYGAAKAFQPRKIAEPAKMSGLDFRDRQTGLRLPQVGEGQSAQPGTPDTIFTRAGSGGRHNAEFKHGALDTHSTRPVDSPERTSALVRASPHQAGKTFNLPGGRIEKDRGLAPMALA